MYKGKLITFEGIDGCGKTTQINLLKEYLLIKGYNAIILREPGGTSIGEEIRKILLYNKNYIYPVTEALLYAASRAQLLAEIIIPALDEGKIIIMDRFVDSSLVYQGYARGLGMEKVMEINRIATYGIKPDLTIFFDITPENALTRRKTRKQNDRFEEENMEFYEKVYEGYHKLINLEPERFVVINAMEDITMVQKSIINIINKII
ncbi:dTMP kinase [Aceticella autotrophica]|uniref:Thymidylate kinase n=1 Tax=Aceticella autotrophica TaxID=2755338 RepID=A0A975AW02_9THEO|nr:dTMP kinase [Aceticella autotrophica]QSZ27418.1 dTMP kinase [Aceticella autotrophica]